MHIKVLAFITLILLQQSVFAITHPACIKTETSDAKTQNTPKPEKPFLDFSEKHNIRQERNKHRKMIYNKLIAAGVPKQVAKYAKKLQLLEKPTVHYSTQPEKTLTITKYISIFEERIPKAKDFLSHNHEELLKVEKKYNVDKEAVVALMLIESNLGQKKGNINILDALFTMSHPYSSSRTEFFTNELIAAFKLLSSGKHYFRNNTLGSWAGAMGYVQFIPSSVLAYAVDGDEDGVIDIINNKVDAMHSAANYLKNAQWSYNTPVMEEISKPEGDICQTIDKPYKEGKLILGELLPQERYFIVYNNYNTLLRWNKSFLFAFAAQKIVTELKK